MLKQRIELALYALLCLLAALLIFALKVEAILALAMSGVKELRKSVLLDHCVVPEPPGMVLTFAASGVRC